MTGYFSASSSPTMQTGMTSQRHAWDVPNPPWAAATTASGIPTSGTPTMTALSPAGKLAKARAWGALS